MKPYFYIGLAIVIICEALLFAGSEWIGIFFTPLVWTGYILVIDAIVHRISGRSRITSGAGSFALICVLSSAYWYVFEFFNLFLKNWRYENLPSFSITAIGMTWAFATIGPGLIETYDLLKGLRAFPVKSRKLTLPHRLPIALIVFGAVCLVSILVVPGGGARYLAIPLWIGFILLLDPINLIRGNESLLAQWQQGRFQNTLCLFIAGLICGILWEFWNYWAVSKWIYQLPYCAGPKVFEMPLLGYLGFPALAFEYYVFYSLAFGWRRTSDALCGLPDPHEKL
jgi:hypothetical protein